MARPKLNKPAKVNMTLTPDPEKRKLLTLISEHEGKSITCMLEEWAVDKGRELGLVDENGRLIGK